MTIIILLLVTVAACLICAYFSNAYREQDTRYSSFDANEKTSEIEVILRLAGLSE